MEFDEDIVDYQGEHEFDETWVDPWEENDLQDRKVKELPERKEYGYKRS